MHRVEDMGWKHTLASHTCTTWSRPPLASCTDHAQTQRQAQKATYSSPEPHFDITRVRRKQQGNGRATAERGGKLARNWR
eukprot:COSAG05_NODE_87_length_20404_cov_42.272051_5_plen_80_part_00